MEKEIKIDISSKEYLVEKYNEDKVSRDVIEYLIKEAMLVEKEEKIKVVINKSSTVLSKDCKELIKNGLKDEYKRSMNKQHDNNVKQIYFFILGILLIFISTLIKEQILKEVLLIAGWVPIWEMVRIEIFPDVAGRVKRRIIKKLLHSEIVERI